MHLQRYRKSCDASLRAGPSISIDPESPDSRNEKTCSFLSSALRCGGKSTVCPRKVVAPAITAQAARNASAAAINNRTCEPRLFSKTISGGLAKYRATCSRWNRMSSLRADCRLSCQAKFFPPAVALPSTAGGPGFRRDGPGRPFAFDTLAEPTAAPALVPAFGHKPTSRDWSAASCLTSPSASPSARCWQPCRPPIPPNHLDFYFDIEPERSLPASWPSPNRPPQLSCDSASSFTSLRLVPPSNPRFRPR